MDERILARVRALRTSDPYLSVKTALAIARDESQPNKRRHDWLDELRSLYGPGHVSGTVQGLNVRVTVVDDEDSRLGEDDVTGWFTDQRSEHTITNTARDWASDYDYYHPSNMMLYAWEPPAGMARGVAAQYRSQQIVQSMREDASRRWYGVTVTVSHNGEQLTSASAWGIDEIDGYDVGPYLVEVASGLIAECVGLLVDSREERLATTRQHVTSLETVLSQLTTELQT